MSFVIGGIVLAVLGPIAYFVLGFFTLLPRHLVERPWPFEVVTLLGFLLAAVGSVIAFRAHRRRRRSVAALLVTVLGSVVLFGYVHWLSRQLPPPPATLARGKTPPALDVIATDGSHITLDSLRGQKTVLVFFRGHWCGFCRSELATLAAEYGKFQDAGAEIIAISSSSVDDMRALSDSMGLPFRLASDPELEVIKSWGLVDPMVGSYARPATLVLDGNGVIQTTWFPADWRVRTPPEEMVAALAKL